MLSCIAHQYRSVLSGGWNYYKHNDPPPVEPSIRKHLVILVTVEIYLTIVQGFNWNSRIVGSVAIGLGLRPLWLLAPHIIPSSYCSYKSQEFWEALGPRTMVSAFNCWQILRAENLNSCQHSLLTVATCLQSVGTCGLRVLRDHRLVELQGHNIGSSLEMIMSDQVISEPTKHSLRVLKVRLNLHFVASSILNWFYLFSLGGLFKLIAFLLVDCTKENLQQEVVG